MKTKTSLSCLALCSIVANAQSENSDFFILKGSDVVTIPIEIADNVYEPENFVTMGEIFANKETDIGGGYAWSHSTMYANGIIVHDSGAKSTSITRGVKAAFFAIGIDAAGRSVYISENYEIPTACGRSDRSSGCSTKKVAVFRAQISPELASLIVRFDIYVEDRSNGSALQRWADNLAQIKATCNYLPLPARIQLGCL